MTRRSPLTWRPPPHWRDARGPRPLLMLTTSYPGGPGELAGHFVQTLARQLAASGHRVQILTPAGPGASRPPGWRRDPGPVEVLRVAYPGWRRGPFHAEGLPERLERPQGRARALALIPGAVAALGAAAWLQARRLGPRVELVGHWLWPGGGVAQLGARALGRGATTICHSGGVRLVTRLPAPLAAPLVRVGLGEGAFVATCADLVHRLERAAGAPLRHRAYVVAMPVEPPRRLGAPPPAPPFRVLTLGRLTPVKGLDLLIAAAAGRSDVALHVAGDGAERDRLAAQAEALGVSARFHGVVTGEAKARLLSTCHGLAMPSRRLPSGRTEGVPVALLEALSYDLPVLATRVGGIPEALGLGGDAPVTGVVTCEPTEARLRAAWPAFVEAMAARWGVAGG